jgi:hypothetical protein
MLKIAPFNHASSNKLRTIFRKPVVADVLNVAGAPEDLEESVLTGYLNALIVETNAPTDTKQWTNEDRKLALWWIFIHINKDSDISLNYQCQHCGNVHIVDYELMELEQGARLLDELPEHAEKFLFDGAKLSVSFKPLLGADMEALAEFRMDYLDAKHSPQANDVDIAKAKAILHLQTMARHITMEGKSTEEIYALIQGMETQEYAKLTIAINGYKEQIRHGLLTEVRDGRALLVSTPLQCEEKEDLSTRLLIDFRLYDYMPPI